MKDHELRFNKGELSSGFNSTSLDTSIQDEKNILLDSLDGDSSYIPRTDTYASAALAGSLRMRNERKEKSNWQHLLLLINQLHEQLEAELREISDLIDQITRVCEETLELIDTLSMQMESILHDHSEIGNMLDNSESIESNGKVENTHVKDMLNRYTARTGSNITSEDDLRFILLTQIEYERSVTLPELQNRLNKSSQLYDESMSAVEHIESQKVKLEELVDQARKKSDESTINELERIQEKVRVLKALAIKQRDDLSYKLDSLENNAAEPMSDEVEDEVSHEASISLQSFGIQNKGLMP